MTDVNKPPTYQLLLASAGGGFVGAVAGVVVATNMMGDPDTGHIQAPEPQEQVLVGQNDK